MAVCKYAMQLCTFEGCGTRVQRRQFDAHATTCNFRPVPCSYCQKHIVVSQLEAHRVSCPSKPVACPNGCGSQIAASALKEHRDVCVKDSKLIAHLKTAFIAAIDAFAETWLHMQRMHPLTLY